MYEFRDLEQRVRNLEQQIRDLEAKLELALQN
jgi:polyhydroxyalkanoate synthesis regulator phasin